MNGADARAKGFLLSLNQGLAEKVAALDREHYPDSLIEIIEAVLLDQTSPRGLPLLAAAINRTGPDAGERVQAAEVILQGLLMTAVLAVGKNPSDGLAAGLAESYDSAHLLLAADTLLTWPFEFVDFAGFPADKSAELALAGRKSLDELAALGKGFRDMLDWQPLQGLLATLCPELAEDSGGPGDKLIRLAYLADLRRWLGLPRWLAGAFEQAARDAGGTALGDELNAVRVLLTE